MVGKDEYGVDKLLDEYPPLLLRRCRPQPVHIDLLQSDQAVPLIVAKMRCEVIVSTSQRRWQ
jgi:hypothetical protein